jgi:hypothetical protein
MPDAARPGEHASSPMGGIPQAPPAPGTDDATLAGIHEPYGPWLTAADRAAGTQAPQSVGYQPQAQWAAPAQQTPEQVAAAQRRRKKIKRRIIVWVIVVLVVAALVVGAFIARAVLAKGKYGPQHQVEDYLQALVDGKASKATELLDPNVTTTERALLTDKVYKAAKKRPSAYDIVSTEVNGDSATVKAKVQQDGKWDTTTFTLLKDGKRDVVFDDWKLDSGPQSTVNVGTVPSTVKVNGQDVELGKAVKAAGTASEDSADEAPNASLPVLPGSYAFSAPKGSKYVTYGDDMTVTRRLGDHANGADPVSFSTSYTSRVYTDAKAQIEKRIAACTTDTKMFVDGCLTASWEDTGWDATQKITREWDSTPTITIKGSDEDTSTEATSASEVSQLHGSLTAQIDADLDIEAEVRDAAPAGEEPNDWTDSSGDSFSPFVDREYNPFAFPITIKGNTLTVGGWDQLDRYNPDHINAENRSKYSQYKPLGG